MTPVDDARSSSARVCVLVCHVVAVATTAIQESVALSLLTHRLRTIEGH